jgi:hypothetical protein
MVLPGYSLGLDVLQDEKYTIQGTFANVAQSNFFQKLMVWLLEPITGP